jgi:predicted helicase
MLQPGCIRSNRVQPGIDQYQFRTDKRSGITNDPSRPDDPQYIVRLISQVITVSLETVKLVKHLPPLQASST